MSQHSCVTISELESKCRSHMAENGIAFEGPLILDGNLHRFSRDRTKNQTDEFYKFDQWEFNGKLYAKCYYGTWSGGLKEYFYKSYETNTILSKEDWIEIKKEEDRRQKEYDEQQQKEKTERLKNAQKYWNEAKDNPIHEDHIAYLQLKRVQPYRVRFGKDPKGKMALVIPIENIDGEIQGVQFISKDGEKRIYGLKKGSFHLIGEVKEESRIIISEGYATAASLYEARGWPVVVAFDCGNLDSVISEIRKKHPKNQIVIAADDDRETQGNPGKTKATEAATRHKCKVIIPKFPADSRLPNGKCPTDFNDLHVHFGLDHVKKQLGEIQQAIEEWNAPTQLPEGLPPVASLEADMLPEPLRDWLLDIAERMQIPVDFSAAAVIVVLGSLIGRRLGIYPKKCDDWLVVPNGWGMIVGRPGIMKSPAIGEVMKPLNRLAAASTKMHNSALERYNLLIMAAKAEKDVLQENLKKAAKQGKDGLDNLLANSSKIETPSPPTERRFKTEDCTIEKIGELLNQNHNGLLVHRDELSGWLRSLEKDGREGDRAFFLESWNGIGNFTVDRITRGTLHIPALCLSLLGGIQPGLLESYVYQATRGGAGDDGLLQRFQFLVWPDVPKGWVNVDRWPNTAAKDRAYELFAKINSYTHPLVAEDLNGDIPAIHFSCDAQEVFDSWRDKLEPRLRSGDLVPALESHLAKNRKTMPSIALIFQVCQDLDLNREIKQVEREAAELAVRWCDYLESHAHRLYSSAENPQLGSARTLLKKIKQGVIADGFTIRDIYQNDWSKLTSTEEVKDAVEILIDFGWLRCEEIPTNGRPKKIFKIHPELRQDKNP